MWAQGGQWNQMPLDAASYQNINHELVDWAALAQQWIQMKEAHETTVVNLPGMIQAHVGYNSLHPGNLHHLPGFTARDSQLTCGEAPMDVEKEEEHFPDVNWPPHVVRPQLSTPWVPTQPIRMGVSQQIGATIPPMPPVFINPQIGASLAALPPLFVNPQVAQPLNSAVRPSIPGNSKAFSPSVNNSLPRLPLRQQSRQGSSDEDSNGSPSSAAVPIDAAKRKNLPAWIREGLEKMEREKQKREERERFLHERELNRKKQLMEENSYETKDPAASRFDDSDESSDGNDSDNNGEGSPRTRSPLRSSQVLSAEDLRLVIRQLMTEVLLEVTTEEVRSTAIETYQQAKVKSRQVQHSLPSKSLTQKLGLDQYGSDSDEDDDGVASSLTAGNQEVAIMSNNKMEREGRKINQTSLDRVAVDRTSPPLSSDVQTKVEMDNLKRNGSENADQAGSQAMEVRNRDSMIEGKHSGFSEKKSQDTSGPKEEKRASRRSSSRDNRRRSRSKERHSKRSRGDRSRSRRRSRSRGKRSSSRSNRRDSSRNRKRSRRSSSRDRRRSSRSRRVSSRDRSRSSSRSKNRDYRRSRS